MAIIIIEHNKIMIKCQHFPNIYSVCQQILVNVCTRGNCKKKQYSPKLLINFNNHWLLSTLKII